MSDAKRWDAKRWDAKRWGAGRWDGKRLLLWLMAAAYVIYFATTLLSSSAYFGETSPGIVAHPYTLGGELYANPTTKRARALCEYPPAQLEVVEINGVSTCEAPPEKCGFVWASSLVNTALGDHNEFVLRHTPTNRLLHVTLPVEQSDAATLLHVLWRNLLLSLIGLLYVLIGALVWWKRPNDPASYPLLLFCLSSGFALSGVFFTSDWARWWGNFARLMQPLMLGFIFLVAHSFSSAKNTTSTWRFRILMGACLLHGVAGFTAVSLWDLGLVDVRPLTELLETILGVLALCGFSLALHATARAARPPNPLALRRRAKVFGWAVALGFFYPSLWLVLRDPIMKSGHEDLFFLGLVVSFISFPAILGYAILRHRMFDLRIVLRQGLVYGVMSLGLTLTYVGVLVFSYQTIDARHSDEAALLVVAVLVVLFGIAKAHLERMIDGMVFRGRQVFRSAVQQTTSALAAAHSVPEVAHALRKPLLDALGLERAYVALVLPNRDDISTYALAPEPSQTERQEPKQLPSALPPQEVAPLRRALDTQMPVTSYDSNALAPHASETSFWETYGLELVVPFGVSRTLDSPRGALLLGSKRNGRPFDPEDTSLVQTLGQQVGLAVENALAFQRLHETSANLRQLVAGIVHEANTPLGALGSSLDTIARLLHRLETHPPDERLYGAADKLLANANSSHLRLNELITALKEYVNLEESSVRQTDLKRCLADAVQLATDKHSRDTSQIRLRLPDGPALAMAHPAKLTRIFGNLIENALAADAESVDVKLEPSALDGAWAVVVSDAGSGIPPELLANIFDFGFSQKTTQSRMSLRLGLPYAKRIVEELGGKIRIQSEPKRGTTVVLELPAFNPDATSRT